jgi:hypothetical protein
VKYLRKSFSVPASENTSDEDWEAIFGTEEERKKKMAAAIEKRNRERKPPPSRAGKKAGGGAQIGFNPMAGGGPGAHFENDAETSQAAQQEAIHEVCERTAPQLGIDADTMKKTVTGVTNDILGESADMHARGTSPEIENKGRPQDRKERIQRKRRR